MRLTSLLLLSACTAGGGDTDTTTGSSSGAATTDASTSASSSGPTPTTGDPTRDTTTTTASATGEPTTGDPTTGDPTTATTGASTGEPGGPPSAAQLLALTRGCMVVSNGDYQSDDEDGAPANIPICGLAGAVFWTADMDVDCDGKMSAQCNLQTDAAYQDQTSATDSKGDPLDAASLPFVVVPLPSARFDYDQAGLALGGVIAVIYQGQVRYGVFGDEGPENIIGEASYAMAASLGIDPDPATGGTDGPVTYIAFTGASALVSTIEDHDEAVQVGEARAAELLQNN
jgi:hypothetical protein